jgi:predicted nucleic acid-binding protein
MKYLLDVNSLIALGHSGHEHHIKTIAWFITVSKSSEALASCSITELGFVRVAVQVRLQPDVATAQKALQKLKSSSHMPFEMIADILGADQLPAFAKTPQRLTDGHLLELARVHEMKLVTLDKGIPGALLIS